MSRRTPVQWGSDTADRSAPRAAAASPARQVEFPERHDKALTGASASTISLGSSEPELGRFNTLSRITYQHGRGTPKVDEDNARPKLPSEIRNETVGFKLFMNNKNFHFGTERREPNGVTAHDYHLPNLTESRVSQQAAAEEAKRTMNPEEIRRERNAHITRMRSSKVFDAATDKSAINSTQRTSFGSTQGKVPTPLERTEEVTKQRTHHGGTHFAFGDVVGPWRSESSTYGLEQDKTAPVRTEKCTRALQCSVQLKTPGLDIHDSLHSINQIDFKKHDGVTVPPKAFSSSEHHMTMGYAPKQLSSLSRESYSPTVFVRASPTPHA